MSRRERRGKWLFFFLAALIFGPLSASTIYFLIFSDECKSPLGWLAIGVGLGSPWIAGYVIQKSLSQWGWWIAAGFICLAVALIRLLPIVPFGVGVSLALLVCAVQEWHQRSNTLGAMIAWPALGFGSIMLFGAGPEAMSVLMQTRTYIGISSTDTNPGVKITEVLKEGPAANAGVNVGDVLTAVDDQSIADSAALRSRIQQLSPGETVKLRIEREGVSSELDIVVGRMPVHITKDSALFKVALGLITLAAGLAVLLLPDVQAFLHFHHTGVSHEAADVPDSANRAGLPRLEGNIFISYRREDSRFVVDRMYDRLKLSFGAERVFRDLDSIPLGSRFSQVLEERMARASVALVIIGPGWVQAKTAEGRRRLDDPEDFVRLEVENALSLGISVIPVLVSFATMPKRQELPATISGMIECNGFNIRPDPDFNRDIDNLIDKLRRFTGNGEVRGCPEEAVTFELESDLQINLHQKNDMLEVHQANERLLAVVGARPMRVVGWEGNPYRVQCEADRDTFEIIRTAFLDGRLDRLTEVRWNSVETLNQGEKTSNLKLPYQAPLALSEKYKENLQGYSLVCHASYIEGFDQEAAEAKAVIGAPTTDLGQMRVYITRRKLHRLFPWFSQVYIHSNYIKPGCRYPTKILTMARISLFTILTNLAFRGLPSRAELDKAMSLHRDCIQYFINERSFGKGNAAFYCGAANVRFVKGGNPDNRAR